MAGVCFGPVPAAVVKSIGASSVTIEVTRGTTSKTLVVDTDSSTKYLEGPFDVGRSALAVGEHVAVLPNRPSGGSENSSGSSTTITAAAIVIQAPSLGGTVVSVAGNVIVVQDRDGFWRTIDVSSATKYEQDGKTASLSGVKKGDVLFAAGTISSDHTTLDASVVAFGAAGSVPGPERSGGWGGPGAFGGPGGPGGPGRPGAFGGPSAFGGTGRIQRPRRRRCRRQLQRLRRLPSRLTPLPDKGPARLRPKT